MTLLFVLLGVGLFFELTLHAGSVFWKARRWLAAVALIVTAFASGALVVWRPNVWSVLIALAGLYRIVNCLRIVEGRMHERYLHHATLRTTLALAGLQLLAMLLWLGWDNWHTTGHLVWALVAAAELGAALVLFFSTVRRMQRTRWPKHAPHLSDNDLPTLTVAIPARNETDDLHDCLESLVASDYPKLEILVYDDCSQTRKTPEIIRSFAHKGVRFIQGIEPDDIWQPKNHAYDRLLREASGEYVLFCGVDVRFAPDSLRQLLRVMLHKRKGMLSLLPWRAAEAERRFAVVQAMRYAWELAPPRRLFNRPPVLSTCWVAKRDALAKVGGFAAVARAIIPEAHFARSFAKDHDGYSFMRGSRHLGIQSVKPAREQHDTAIRMRYPQLRRRPENVFLLGQAYGFFIVMPFALTVAGFWVSIGVFAHIAAALAAVLHTIVYLTVVVATRTGSPWLGFAALPYGILYDLALLHISMWQYEFSEIEWKGRNVCIPVMHVIPRLPKMDDRL